MYSVNLSKRSIKDLKKLEAAGLLPKLKLLLNIIRNNPFQNPPPYEKLRGYASVYSRRINSQHRLVYEIYDNGTIYVMKIWTHYE